MKNKNIFTGLYGAVIAVAVLALISWDLFAQQQEQNRQCFQELRSEMQNFAKTNVLPDLKTWKSKLDNAMSAEDLQKLNELRGKATQLRTQMRQRMRGQRNYYCQDSSRMGRGNRGNKGFRGGRHGQGSEEFKQLAQELKPFAEKYKTTLEEIGKQAQQKKEQWKSQAKDIFEKWREKNQSQLSDIKQNSKRHRFQDSCPNFERSRFMRNLDPETKKKTTVARFMLWDGNEDFIQGPEDNGFDAPQDIFMNIDESEFGSIPEFSNSPNPFSEKTTIKFSLNKDENVSLTIVDNSGNKVAVLYNGKLNAGSHSFDFDVSQPEYKELSSGAYFYKLQTDSFSKTGKMLLTR